ncbi:NnrU family protein [Sphingomonas sp. LHG3443-2]|uniref:NnrU family protein n=1 Tax=Sphingomonas sp. LHG3443-2 TaxID=2804639 RepID=UPI003CE7632F
MSAAAATTLFAALFVATHLLLSHPLRAPLVARLGPKGFLAAYSAVSFACFVPMVLARRAAGAESLMWSVPGWVWSAALPVMWLACVLLAGSFVRNPAMETLQRHDAVIGRPAGVFRWTRHPMMWSFASWALVHLAVNPEPSAVAIAVAILLLALVGAQAQDAKKRRQLGPRWAEWERQTSFVPFGRGLAQPGWFAVAGGTTIFLLATWLHPLPVGVWALR